MSESNSVGKKERRGNGQYEPKFEDREFLEAVRDTELATSSDVAEKVGCSRDWAYKKLNTLVDEDKVEKTGLAKGYVSVWSLTEAGKRELEDD